MSSTTTEHSTQASVRENQDQLRDIFFCVRRRNAVTHAQRSASLGYVGLGRMLLPYPLKTPPPSSSALRTDNPGKKTCRQSSGLSFQN